MTRSERLTERTCKLIRQGKAIVLKRADGCYLHQWTLIQAGPDNANWSEKRELAMEVFSLEWAFAIAPLYKCKVYSYKAFK
jgi:hypothetical protein